MTSKPYSEINWQLWRHCVSCGYPWRWYLRYLSYPSVPLWNTSSINVSHLLHKQEAEYSSVEPCVWVRVAKRRKIKFLKGPVMLYFTLYTYAWKLLQLSCVMAFLFVFVSKSLVKKRIWCERKWKGNADFSTTPIYSLPGFSICFM